MNNLAWRVRNTRTGNLVAAFLLRTDADKYAALLHAREGVHGGQYAVELGVGILGRAKVRVAWLKGLSEVDTREVKK